MPIKTGRPQSEITARPEKYPQGKFKDKACKFCGELFSPLAPSHLFCSDDCKDHASSDVYYLKNYGITYNEVKDILNKQQGVCAICKKVGFKMHEGIRNPLNLDHCHSTGKVRGMLCHNCNRALGLFQDDIESLKTAIEYLEGATTIRKE